MDSQGAQAPRGLKGPHDDFFCHKYQVWYRVEDCVYRGRNRTFAGCVNCFQGRLNMRSVEKGLRPPVFLGDEPSGTPHHEGSGALLQLRRST
ncbi:MAG TPA: hypothetical protein VFP98_03485 [Candidatus Polarisedimenticolia bacterium]|nr:hypothetical protein [Candidatus Polarisedimenticolia bacterium]